MGTPIGEIEEPIPIWTRKEDIDQQDFTEFPPSRLKRLESRNEEGETTSTS